MGGVLYRLIVIIARGGDALFPHAVQVDVSRKCVLMLSLFSDCFLCAQQHAWCSAKFGAHTSQSARRGSLADMVTVAHSPFLSALVVANPAGVLFPPPFC